MKIEVKQNKHGVKFGDIFPGVVFQYSDSYYIKMSVTVRFEGADYNAIDLDEGEPFLLDNEDEVFIPFAKLVIE